MSTFPLLFKLWLSAHYAAVLVLAQNRTTVTTTTTIVMPGFTSPAKSHAAFPSSEFATAYPTSTDVLALAATSTTVTATGEAQSDAPQLYASDSGTPTPTLATSTKGVATTPSSPPLTTHAPFRHKPTSPAWMLPASISLLCYDFVAATTFLWFWVMGWFWWWEQRRRGQRARVGVSRQGDEAMLQLAMHENLEREMRRLGMA